MKKPKAKTTTSTMEALIAGAINPGSKAAIDAGCTCPVMDNEYGAGYMGMEGVYIYSGGCKIHSLPTKSTNNENEN